MLLSSLAIVQLLALGGFLLTPGEPVTYYVSPTEPPNSDCACPDQSCHTMDYYSCNRGSYFNSEKINGAVTLTLMQGNHILRKCSFAVEHLETCEIIGKGPARNVIVYYSFHLLILSVYIANLTFIADRSLNPMTLFLLTVTLGHT